MGNIERMTSRPDNSEQSYSEQLSDFEGQLKQTMDDASLLQDVHRTIRELLTEHQDSEADIRNILLTRLESGALRQESFQLVRIMLDRIVSDDIDTLPGLELNDDTYASDFGETDVIATQSLDADLPEERLQVGSVLRDRFLLKERVAGGSMGVVYKALDRRLAEADATAPWVAIKVLSPKLSRNGNALRALQQEAAKGRCLSHPNIVRFLDLDRDDELYFIVLEWLEGRSLASILDDAKSKKIDVMTALDIVNQLGRALDYAHRCGVVHADVKPANVMIDLAGQVKLFDFGVARIRQKQSDTLSKFDPAVLGAVTPAYSSMQVLTGDEPVPADDVFSLGCLMYRLIAGYRVFGPRNAAEAAESGMEPQRPQGLGDSQWKALKKALAYSRVARYSSPKQFIEDLQLAENESPAQVSAGEPIVENTDTRSPRRWPYALVVTASLLAVAYVGTQTELLDDYLPQLSNDAVGVATPDAAIIQGPPASIEPAAAAIRENESSDETAAVDEISDITDDTVTMLPAVEDDSVSIYDVFGDDYRDTFPEMATDVEAPGSNERVESESTVPATHDLTLARSGAPAPNTVAFWLHQVSVRESDPVVQIDVLRLNPDSQAFEVNYIVRDISATEGEDYFVPSVTTISFAANQRSARLLIPLVQDSKVEIDETFLLEIFSTAPGDEANINRRITVMIRDDDTAAQ